MALVSLLLLSVCLAEIQCQTTFPYISFLGQTLANHSYVDLSLVRDYYDGSDSVQCHTDLRTCCSVSQGPHRGDWYYPDRLRVQFPGVENIHESRGDMRVDFRARHTATSPSGIYLCGIQTVAVHSDMDISVGESVYVGLYGSGGE